MKNRRICIIFIYVFTAVFVTSTISNALSRNDYLGSEEKRAIENLESNGHDVTEFEKMMKKWKDYLKESKNLKEVKSTLKVDLKEEEKGKSLEAKDIKNIIAKLEDRDLDNQEFIKNGEKLIQNRDKPEMKFHIARLAFERGLADYAYKNAKDIILKEPHNQEYKMLYKRIIEYKNDKYENDENRKNQFKEKVKKLKKKYKENSEKTKQETEDMEG